MGSGFSVANNDQPCLGDLPDHCLAKVLAYLDPVDICNLARTNRAFYRASSADLVWEAKLPENYRILIQKLILFDGSLEGWRKKDIYGGLCRPIRISRGTKEIWMEKRRGGICMSASWKGMKITGIDDRRYWSYIHTPHSRFQSVAYLKHIWWLEVEGEVEFEFPAGHYRLSFCLQLNPKWSSTIQQVHGWNMKPVRFQFSVSNGQSVTLECYINEQQNEWHVGDFVVENSYKPTKINYSMLQIDCTHQKGGLAFDSVLISQTRRSQATNLY